MMFKRENKKVVAMQARAVLLETERLNFNFPRYQNTRKMLLVEGAGLVRSILFPMLQRAAAKNWFIKMGDTQVLKVMDFDPKSGIIRGDVYDIKHGVEPGTGFIDRLNRTKAGRWFGDLQHKPKVVNQSIHYETLVNPSLFNSISGRIDNMQTINDIVAYFRGGYKAVEEVVDGKKITRQEPLPSYIGDLAALTEDFIDMFGAKGAMNKQTLELVLKKMSGIDLHNVFANLIETKMRRIKGTGQVPTNFKEGTGNNVGYWMPKGTEIKSMQDLKVAFRIKVNKIAELSDLTKQERNDIADHYMEQFEGLPTFERKFANIAEKETGHQHWNLRGTGGAALSPTAKTSEYSFSSVANIEKELLDNPTGAPAGLFLDMMKFKGVSTRQMLNTWFKKTFWPKINGWVIPFRNKWFDEMLDLDFLWNNGYKEWDDIVDLPIAKVLEAQYGRKAITKSHGMGLLDVMDPATREAFGKENPVKIGWGKGTYKDATGKIIDLEDEFHRKWKNFIWKNGVETGYKDIYRTQPKLARLYAGNAFMAYWAVWAIFNPLDAITEPFVMIYDYFKGTSERDLFIGKMLEGLMRGNKKCLDSIHRQWMVSHRDADGNPKNKEEYPQEWGNYFSEQISTNMDCVDAYNKGFKQIQNTFTDAQMGAMIANYSDWAEVFKKTPDYQKLLDDMSAGKDAQWILNKFEAQNPELRN